MKHIKELFDNPKPFFVRAQNSTEFVAEFEVYEDVAFEVSIMKYGDMWEIVFYPSDASPATLYKLTDEGDQFIIFSTVAAVIEEFLDAYDPEKFEFSAKEKKRQRLYKIFADKLAKEYNYSYTSEISSNREIGLKFEFTRN